MEKLPREGISDDVRSPWDVPDSEVNPGGDKDFRGTPENVVITLECMERMKDVHSVHAISEDRDMVWPARQGGHPDQRRQNCEALIPENAARKPRRWHRR